MPTIFEQIVDGEIPARIVHETDTTLAFLDANPLARGHTLVLPKEPYEQLHDLPAEISTAVFSVVHGFTPAIKGPAPARPPPNGHNNGPPAGQEIPHAHVHIIPRFEGDGGGPIHAISPTNPEPTEDELDAIEDAISEG